jgi:Holliday junction DNA helicase RuvA
VPSASSWSSRTGWERPTRGSGRRRDAVAASAPPAAGDAWRGQVHTGLVGLGWSAREARTAVDAVAPLAEETTADGAPDVADLLRAALRVLSRA